MAWENTSVGKIRVAERTEIISNINFKLVF